MSEQSVQYRKLPGRAVGWSGNSRLWLGEDHVILVSSAFGFESYQRVYFKDIEALIVARTKVRLIWNCIFGAVVATGVAFGMLTGALKGTGGGPEAIASAILLSIFIGLPVTVALIGLLVNTFRGASCALWVQTAGGVEHLGAPARIRAARRVVDTITPLIEQAQAQTIRQSSTMVNSPSS